MIGISFHQMLVISALLVHITCASELTQIEHSATCLLQTSLESPDTIRISFDKFIIRHNKVYESSSEEALHYAAFQRTLEQNEANNAERRSRGADETQGITKFADYTTEESKKLRGFIPMHKSTGFIPMHQLTLQKVSMENFECVACKNFPHEALANDTIDWRALGAVTPVKDQGSCGSCWAFSTTGVIEGAQYLNDLTLVERSEEQLVQCDTKKDSGCDGGMMEYALEYLSTSQGLDTEKNYPYTKYTYKGNTYLKGEKLHCDDYTSSSDPAWLQVSTFKFVSYNDANGEKNMKTALYKGGPLSIAINALPMLSYVGGIDDPSEKECGSSFSDLDHGVLLVGFSQKDGGLAYWVIKNSWSADWGLSGYYELVYGKNACGVANYVIHANVV